MQGQENSRAAQASLQSTQNTAPRPQIFWRLPTTVRRSPLWQYGGFGVFENLLDPPTLAGLKNEAFHRMSGAEEQFVAELDREELRGGQPQRKFLSTEGGKVQDGFYRSPETARLLGQITHASFVPTGRRGTFTYYRAPGDHLAIHRDIETCDLAVITALHLAGRSLGGSGTLCLYPNRINEPLSGIHSRPNEGAVLQDLRPGQTIVLFGGLIPHRILPLAAGQLRIVSVLCFRAA